jgi:hypothetical protein
MQRPGDKDYVPPISFLSQLWAVLLMRFQVQIKQRWSNCLNICFVIVAIILTVILGLASIPTIQSGRLCPGVCELPTDRRQLTRSKS